MSESKKMQNVLSCWLNAEIQYSKIKKKKKELEQGFTTGLFFPSLNTFFVILSPKVIPSYAHWRYLKLHRLGELSKASSIHLWERLFLSLSIFSKHCERSWFLLPEFTSHMGLHKKPFRELRTLCLQAQLVVTLEVKRCFRSQRAVQPSSASTKCCLCWGYFQTSCADVLLRRRAFPPGTSPRCCFSITCMVIIIF